MTCSCNIADTSCTLLPQGAVLAPGWQPASARVLPVMIAPGLCLRGQLAEQVVQAWPARSSADALDYTLTPAAWLQSTGDTLAKVEASVPTATGQNTDLAVLWVTIIQGMACVFLGSGPPDTVQTVQMVLHTVQGRSVTVNVQLYISAQSAATPPPQMPTLADGTPIPPNAVLAPQGVLTNSTGQPFLLA
ncbi:hypothetical protein CSR02_06180 [Acetobacter pomorum]|uniref:Uncharacterized protein n=1 Tax=Acetobacter pomorum TaxID=65959 RepID=A0A2G4RET1_9PROT|nr:hypothetical protein [Acetobacter pomorum]PHY94245.1 hypothetical protein CSR02_06180 [Acetobacter pomorum]